MVRWVLLFILFIGTNTNAIDDQLSFTLLPSQ